MKKTAFLCLMLAAVLYFAGSFWQPLLLGQNGHSAMHLPGI